MTIYSAAGITTRVSNTFKHVSAVDVSWKLVTGRSWGCRSSLEKVWVDYLHLMALSAQLGHVVPLVLHNYW